MNTSKRYSPEVRDWAVGMVRRHEQEYTSQWAAIEPISQKFGCTSETIRNGIRVSGSPFFENGRLPEKRRPRLVPRGPEKSTTYRRIRGFRGGSL